MSCGTDESAFNSTGTHYWSWQLQNGSYVFCDYIPQCEAFFKADTDIGGWGVLIAFIVPAYLTIITAACNAYNPAKDTLKRFLHWYTQRRKPPAERTGLNVSVRHLLDEITDLLLLALCDLQLITGIAIIAAGMSQWHAISFYHRALVVDYWYLTINSLWAGRVSHYRTITNEARNEEPSIWEFIRTRTRNIGIIVSLVLATIYTSYTLISEWYQWDVFASGKCYRYHDNSTWASNWLWVAGQIILAATSCVQLTNWGHETVERINKSTRRSREWLLGCCADQIAQLPPLSSLYAYSPMTLTRFAGSYLILFVWTTGLILLWTAAQFWAIWSAGEGFQAVTVAFFAGFAIWSTFDIIDQKESSKPLLVGSESSWGFGQVLPLLLLATLGFNALDVAQEMHVRRTRRQHEWRTSGRVPLNNHSEHASLSLVRDKEDDAEDENELGSSCH